MRVMPTGEEPSAPRGPPPPVKLNPKPKKKKKLKVKKEALINKFQLVSISEHAPLLEDDISNMAPPPARNRKPKRNLTIEDKLSADILPKLPAKVATDKPLIVAAAPTSKPQEIAVSFAKDVESDKSAQDESNPGTDTCAKPLSVDRVDSGRKSPNSLLMALNFLSPNPQQQTASPAMEVEDDTAASAPVKEESDKPAQDESNLGADTCEKPLSEDTVDSGRKSPNALLMALSFLSPKPQQHTASPAMEVEDDTAASASVKEESQMLERETPASIDQPPPIEEGNLIADSPEKALSVDTKDIGMKASKFIAPIVFKRPEKAIKPKTSLPASKELTASAEDKTATEDHPHSVKVSKSETSTFARTSEQEEINLVNSAAVASPVSARDDVPAPKLELKSNDTYATAISGVGAWKEDDTQVSKLKKHIPLSTKHPGNEFHEPVVDEVAVTAPAVTSTGVALSVKDDTPAPLPKLKLKKNIPVAAAAGAATGVVLSVEGDTSVASAPKLKRNPYVSAADAAKATKDDTSAQAAAAVPSDNSSVASAPKLNLNSSVTAAGASEEVKDDIPPQAPKLRLKKAIPTAASITIDDSLVASAPKLKRNPFVTAAGASKEVKDATSAPKLKLKKSSPAAPLAATDDVAVASAPKLKRNPTATSAGVVKETKDDTPVPAPKLKRNKKDPAVAALAQEDDSSVETIA